MPQPLPTTIEATGDLLRGQDYIADRALSLGASCVRTDELSRAFAIFARGGSWIDPIYVRRIIDKRGRVLVDDRHPEDPRMDVRGRIDRIGGFARTPPRRMTTFASSSSPTVRRLTPSGR